MKTPSLGVKCNPLSPISGRDFPLAVFLSGGGALGHAHTHQLLSAGLMCERKFLLMPSHDSHRALSSIVFLRS